jgi:hypothetical protein
MTTALLPTDPLFCEAVFAPPEPTVERGALHAGAIWEGTQRSGRVRYSVKVTLEWSVVAIAPLPVDS